MIEPAAEESSDDQLDKVTCPYCHSSLNQYGHSTNTLSDTEKVTIQLTAADVIQKHWVILKERLSPSFVVDVLYNGKLISMVDVEEIYYSNNRRRSAHLLLDTISRSSLQTCLAFATILVKDVNETLKQVGDAIVEEITAASPDTTVPKEMLDCLSDASSVQSRHRMFGCLPSRCNIV
ncbi:uncharacterized protein LOC134190246 [Corticium candelabrum]|uniref:uncharacterized protein LOC134190246 n=1 Tax=Corticium candelabrum TaxID=121492 RepID=UPI002E262D5E|nr:uncharacterized protein LOC134190246 [Corticium candelabrum]